MKLHPLASYRSPEYPTRETLQSEPERLRAIPRRWRGKRAVLGALAGALALMNQSCSLLSWVSPRGKIAIPRSIVPEDEAKAIIEQESRSKATVHVPSENREVGGAPVTVPPFMGAPAIPQSMIPEDQAKAAADQAANSQQAPQH